LARTFLIRRTGRILEFSGMPQASFEPTQGA
jgi:hypothetical protein